MAISPARYRELGFFGKNVRYFELPGVNHFAWDFAYRDASLFARLLPIRRNPFPDRVVYSTFSPRFNQAYWVRIDRIDDMRWPDALKVGIAQAFALIPGTSRSGATIIGGMLFGLSRRAATEFSFFLAVPTLCAAGGYDLWKNRALFSADDLGMFAVGLAVSFASAFVVIRWLIRYVAHHDFMPFVWYRIAFGAVILVLLVRPGGLFTRRQVAERV